MVAGGGLSQRSADETPYLGRADECRRALAALGAGTGVIVAGDVGSGRDRFMSEVVARATDAQRGRLWVGRDVDRLDDARSERLARAVESGEIIPIASAHARRPLPRALDDLRRHGALVIVELGPLSARELGRFAELQLGAPLDPSAAMEFIPSRGGDHIAALSEALESARLGGALTLADGTFSLSSTPPPRNDRLRSLVFTRTGVDIRSEIPHSETLVDLLGLVPGARLDVAIGIAEHAGISVGEGRRDLERLEDAGVIVVEPSPISESVRLRDGIDEVLIGSTIGVLRRRRLASAVIATLGRGLHSEMTPGELVALSRLGLESGAKVPTDILIRAARASLRSPAAGLSIRFARAALDAGGGFDAEMTMAAAEAQTGAADAALSRLARTVDLAADDLQRTDALHAMIRLVRESAAQAGWAVDDGTVDRLAVADSRRDMLKGMMLFNLGDPAAALALIAPTLPDLAGLEAADAWLHVASVHIIQGQVARAQSALDKAEEAYAAAGSDASGVLMARVSVDVLRGSVHDALPAVEAVRDKAIAFGQPVAQGMSGWAIGNLLVVTGSVGDAIREFRSALGVLDQTGLSRTREFILMDLALALALSGDEAGALEVLPWPDAESIGPRSDVVGKFHQVEGWIHISAGRRVEARASFERAAAVYASAGLLMPCMAVLVDAARAGGARESLARIEQLAVDMDGECIEVGVRLARALAAWESIDPADPSAAARLAGEFDGVGGAAAAIGQHHPAAEAFDHASMLHRRAGDVRAAAASAIQRDRRIADCGLTHLPLLREIAPVAMSPREWQVARLAASGHTNRGIAEQLVLSVRTVETHLLRVYRKLGVRGRAEIRDALAAIDGPTSAGGLAETADR
jgi:DNA-binding CsgD family transcriptional regulator